MDYIISKKLANDRLYAYSQRRFWFWDEARFLWKESHLLAAKFERAREAIAALTPEAFLTDGVDFVPLEDYELDLSMVEALKNATPCKNAPIEPVKEESACPSLDQAESSSAPHSPAPIGDAAVTTASLPHQLR